MSARPILVDTTRLLTRLGHRSPTGIDRVDLAYARHFLNGQPGRRAVAATRFGLRLLPESRLEALMEAIDGRWGDGLPAGADPALAALRSRLAGAPAPPAPPARTDPFAPVGEFLRRERFAAGAFRWEEIGEAPTDAVYLHTSHIRLDRPEVFGPLLARPDIRPVFFVHDLIPIDFPEYVVPGEDARHRVRMSTIATHGAAVLANSAEVGRRYAAHAEADGLRRVPVTVAPLGVEGAFLDGAAPGPAGRPYFVICSTVEARKNHLLLLQVWRELAGRLGPDTPALVVVGRRGWESEAAADLLDRCPALRPHVFETTGLGNAGLAELVVGARALLMPSFAEGYGIPIAEALSVGTPVVASDIPVFREVAGTHAAFLHPLDGPAWLSTIAAIAGQAPRRIDRSAYAPPTWEAHFRIVESALDAIGKPPGSTEVRDG